MILNLLQTIIKHFYLKNKQTILLFYNFFKKIYFLKKMCNSTNTMVKHHVVSVKINTFFKSINFQNGIQIFLEKIVEQDVSKIYQQILRNTSETSRVFFFFFFACVFQTVCLSHSHCLLLVIDGTPIELSHKLDGVSFC